MSSRLKKLIATDASKDRFLPTVKKALPFRIDPEGAREAVLLLHGLTGTPSELIPLGKALAEAGYAVYAPRHPGHGTSRADLFTCDETDWVRNSLDAYLDLQATYKTIHVVGHSMGGLLATTVAMVFNAPKLILLAPAYLLGMQKARWTMFLSRFKKVIIRNSPIPEDELNSPDQLQLRKEYWVDEMILPVACLFRLSIQVRRSISRLRSRTFVIVGGKDAVVPPEVAGLIQKIAVNAESVDTHVLPEAGHLFPFDESKDETIRLVLEWIGKPENR